MSLPFHIANGQQMRARLICANFQVIETTVPTQPVQRLFGKPIPVPPKRLTELWLPFHFWRIDDNGVAVYLEGD